MAALEAFLIGSFIAMVTSFPTGAPPGTCVSMKPVHAASTGTDPSSFSITVSPAMYGPGDDITVTLSTSGEIFRGFIIQARKSGETTSYGTFKDPAAATQLLTCTGPNSAWTHSDKTHKTSVSATWTAPNSDMGTLAFQATVVQEYDEGKGISIFYENIMSADVPYVSVGPTGLSPTTKDGGGGMVRGSLLITVISLLTIILVTRHL